MVKLYITIYSWRPLTANEYVYACMRVCVWLRINMFVCVCPFVLCICKSACNFAIFRSYFSYLFWSLSTPIQPPARRRWRNAMSMLAWSGIVATTAACRGNFVHLYVGWLHRHLFVCTFVCKICEWVRWRCMLLLLLLLLPTFRRDVILTISQVFPHHTKSLFFCFFVLLNPSDTPEILAFSAPSSVLKSCTCLRQDISMDNVNVLSLVQQDKRAVVAHGKLHRIHGVWDCLYVGILLLNRTIFA